MESSGFKTTVKKICKGIEEMWNNFIEVWLKIATPIISAGVAAKTKNPRAGQVTLNILKSLTGNGKTVSLTDMHGHGLGLKVM